MAVTRNGLTSSKICAGFARQAASAISTVPAGETNSSSPSRMTSTTGWHGWAADPKEWVTFLETVAEFGAQYALRSSRVPASRIRLRCRVQAGGKAWASGDGYQPGAVGVDDELDSV